jgi:hypothetical protein
MTAEALYSLPYLLIHSREMRFRFLNFNPLRSMVCFIQD